MGAAQQSKPGTDTQATEKKKKKNLVLLGGRTKAGP